MSAASPKRSRARDAKPPLKQRLANQVQLRRSQATAVRKDPWVLGVWGRQALLRMWRLRGGGFYGIGFVATFVYTQAQSLFEDVAEADGMVDFLTSQLSEAIIRLTGDFLGNLLTAFLWPLWVLGWAGAWGLVALLVSFFVFDRWIKPWINAQFPDESAATPADADSSEHPNG